MEAMGEVGFVEKGGGEGGGVVGGGGEGVAGDACSSCAAVAVGNTVVVIAVVVTVTATTAFVGIRFTTPAATRSKRIFRQTLHPYSNLRHVSHFAHQASLSQTAIRIIVAAAATIIIAGVFAKTGAMDGTGAAHAAEEFGVAPFDEGGSRGERRGIDIVGIVVIGGGVGKDGAREVDSTEGSWSSRRCRGF